MRITSRSRLVWCWPVLPQEADIPPGVSIQPFAGSQDGLVDAVADADGLLVRRGYVVDDTVLAHAPKLRFIQRAGTNLSNVDTARAAARGIRVATMPMHIDISVAEHALALMLGLTRRVVDADNAVRSGAYRELDLEPLATDETTIATNWMGYGSVPTLYGRTLGIVGYGEIGRFLAVRAAALGMRVLFYQRSPRETGPTQPATYADLEQLLSAGDFVSLHVPLTPATRHLVDGDFLRRMRRGAYLVNVSRGPVVDEHALLGALRRGWLAGAGLDVFATEPLPADAPLLAAPNLLLSPHLASGTDIALDMAALMKSIVAGLAS